jgi:hypothetical protein
MFLLFYFLLSAFFVGKGGIGQVANLTFLWIIYNRRVKMILIFGKLNIGRVRIEIYAVKLFVSGHELSMNGWEFAKMKDYGVDPMGNSNGNLGVVGPSVHKSG